MAKKKASISLPNSNLYLKGKGNDVNGNSIVQLDFPNQRAFSIQTNGNLPKSHWDLIHAKNIFDLKDKFLLTLEKEVAHYVSNYGSQKQQNSLMMSADLKQKIKRMKTGGTVETDFDANEILKHFIIAGLWATTDDEENALEQEYSFDSVSNQSL